MSEQDNIDMHSSHETEGPENGGAQGDSGGSGDEPPRQGPDWEQPGASLMDRYFYTVVDVLTRPVSFFESLRPSGPVGMPLAFAAIGIAVSAVLTFIYIQGFGVSYMLLVERSLMWQEAMDCQGRVQISPRIHVMGLALIAWFTLVVLIVQAGAAHLLLMLIGKRAAGFAGTVRIYAYARGGLAWLSLIPICDDVMIMVGGVVLAVIGIDRMHRCGVGWACFCVLAPILMMCCGCCAWLWVAQWV